MTQLVSCAIFFILQSQVNSHSDSQSCSTSNVFLVISWAKPAFFCVSHCVSLLRRWLFHTQFFGLSTLERVKLWSVHSFISLTHLSLTQHWSLREHSYVQSRSPQPASVWLKSLSDSDCFLSSARDEETVVSGLCSSQFSPLCFTVAKTNFSLCPKTYRVIPPHIHNKTKTLLLSWCCEINDSVTSLISTVFTALMEIWKIISKSFSKSKSRQ